MSKDNVTLLLQRRDVGTFLDAVEGAILDFEVTELCDDKGCDICERKRQSLFRVKDSILAIASIETGSGHTGAPRSRRKSKKNTSSEKSGGGKESR